MLKLILFLTSLVLANAGSPGVPWTEEQANIIRDKILYLWNDNIGFTMQFDHRYKNAPFKDWTYDPTKILITKNCIYGCMSLCDSWYNEPNRLDDQGFTARKALRLAFHDCIPYKDNDGNPIAGTGCDGCLNIDEDLIDNNGLQITMAVLVRSSFPQYGKYSLLLT